MFDFIKRHPYLTIAAFINIVVFTFFPLEIVTALAITATAFVTYSFGSLLIQFINWMFSDEEVAFSESAQSEPCYSGSYVKMDRAYVASPSRHFSNEYTADELTELADLSDKLNQLLEPLTLCGITQDRCEDPIIASDLYIYDNTEHAYKGIVSRNMPSSYTREPFLKAPFPFSFVKLKDLCSALNDPNNTPDITIQKLLDLAICPVTKEIMKEPKIAHLKYYDRQNHLHDFVLVCDQMALDVLPPNASVSLATKTTRVQKANGQWEENVVGHRLDWAELKSIINDELVGPKLAAAYAAKPDRPEKNLAQAWEAAYIEARADFPTAPPTEIYRPRLW